MNDPFKMRIDDLVVHNRVPYTDDDGGYDPTMPSASYFLPRLDPGPSAVPVDPGQASAQQRFTQSQAFLQGIIPKPDIASLKLDNDPASPSATSLDPSAFQPQTDPRVLTPPPPGAITLTTPDNDPFYAPAGTDFNEVYKAGQQLRGNSLRHRLEAVADALSHKGTFDYQGRARHSTAIIGGQVISRWACT